MPDIKSTYCLQLILMTEIHAIKISLYIAIVKPIACTVYTLEAGGYADTSKCSQSQYQ